MWKFCIFCWSKNIKEKNNEHIIPQRLIKMTWDPKRIVNLWIKMNEKDIDIRKYDISSFKFPSCEKCNNRAANNLEPTAKLAIEKISNWEKINFVETTILLDRFDKIRIGIWLAYNYLDKNYLWIKPKFYIFDRMRRHDRMLIIYKLNRGLKWLHFTQGNMPAFQHCPASFWLRINNLYFTNISWPFLLAKKIWFPYIKMKDIHKEEVSLSIINKKLNYPFTKINILKWWLELYQVCFNDFIQFDSNNYYKNISKELCINKELLISNIFYKEPWKGEIKKLTKQSINLWKGVNYWLEDFSKNNIKIQNFFIDDIIKKEVFKKDTRKYFKEIRRMNEMLLKH